MKPSRKLAQCRFEVLSYTWCDGFINSYLDDDESTVIFDCIEEAMEDLQHDFDIWSDQVRSGERAPETVFEDKEFLVRCVNTEMECKVQLVLGTLFLVTDDGEYIKRESFSEINRTGEFHSKPPAQ